MKQLISDEQIRKAVEVIRKICESKESSVNILDDNDEIFLDFGFNKIPQINNKIFKIRLPNSILSDDADICFFVDDREKKPQRSSIEDNIEYYKDRLEAIGITSITEIIPLLKLKLEYQPFEAKRQLANRFDLFLATDNIIRLLPSNLGKSFYGRKKHPIQIRTGEKDMEKDLRKVLSSTICIMNGKGHSNTVTVARQRMTDDEVFDNIKAAMDKITTDIPGGVANLRSLHLRLPSSPAIPLYISNESRSDVKLPEPEKEEEESEPEEVSTLSDKVKVNLTGEVTFFKSSGEVKTVVGNDLKDLHKLSGRKSVRSRPRGVTKVPRNAGPLKKRHLTKKTSQKTPATGGSVRKIKKEVGKAGKIKENASPKAATMKSKDLKQESQGLKRKDRDSTDLVFSKAKVPKKVPLKKSKMAKPAAGSA